MVEVIGAVFIIVLGTLFHFIYEWSGHNKLIGYFVAVNESTWEHIKLVIGPSLLWFIFELHYYSGYGTLFFAKFISMSVMITFIPLVFYSYKHFTKKPILFVDITSFIVAVILGEFVFHLLINMDLSTLFLKHLGIFGLVLIFIKYIFSAYTPEKNFIYQDPITKKYGVEGHPHDNK